MLPRMSLSLQALDIDLAEALSGRQSMVEMGIARYVRVLGLVCMVGFNVRFFIIYFE